MSLRHSGCIARRLRRARLRGDGAINAREARRIAGHWGIGLGGIQPVTASSGPMDATGRDRRERRIRELDGSAAGSIESLRLRSTGLPKLDETDRRFELVACQNSVDGDLATSQRLGA